MAGRAAIAACGFAWTSRYRARVRFRPPSKGPKRLLLLNVAAARSHPRQTRRTLRLRPAQVSTPARALARRGWARPAPERAEQAPLGPPGRAWGARASARRGSVVRRIGWGRRQVTSRKLDFGHFSENPQGYQGLSRNGLVFEKCLFFKALTQKWPKSSSEVISSQPRLRPPSV